MRNDIERQSQKRQTESSERIKNNIESNGFGLHAAVTTFAKIQFFYQVSDSLNKKKEEEKTNTKSIIIIIIIMNGASLFGKKILICSLFDIFR